MVHRPAGAVLRAGDLDISALVTQRAGGIVAFNLLRRGHGRSGASTTSAGVRPRRLRGLGANSCSAARPGLTGLQDGQDRISHRPILLILVHHPTNLGSETERDQTMPTLLDANFEYPDLVAVAESMIAGTIRPKDAFKLARKVLGGEVRQTSVGQARVIGPQSGGMKVMAELQTYANAHDQQSVERWAAFALITEVLLGHVDQEPEIAPLSLSHALKGFDACVRATGARCPPAAVEFATHMVDSILSNPACTDPELRKRLADAKSKFKACATPKGLRGWAKSLFK